MFLSTVLAVISGLTIALAMSTRNASQSPDLSSKKTEQCVGRTATDTHLHQVLVAVVFSAADKGPSVSAVVQLTSDYCLSFFKYDM